MLPVMKNEIKYENKNIKAFNGINVREDYASGDICEEINMSSQMYPSLCTRAPRKIREITDGTITGISSCEGLVYTLSDSSGRVFLNYKNKSYEFTSLTSSAPDVRRDFASLSDSILIIPDNVIFIPSTGKFRPVCISQYGDINTAKAKYISENNGEAPVNSEFTYIGEVKHNALRCRIKTVANKYNFYYFAFDSNLKSGDVVTLKLEVATDDVDDQAEYYQYRKKMSAGTEVKIKGITTLYNETNSGIKEECVELIFDDYSLDTGGYSDVVFKSITLERKMPTLKKICSFANRIWGITDRELRCSRLGDASEWNDFTSDSYGTMPYACFSSPSPTEGTFTSIVSFGNYVYAFKENVIHKVYGDNPDEFVLRTVETNGVPPEKGDTVMKCDSAVYYFSYNGIYKFDGNTSRRISYCLGSDIDFECAGGNEDAYYAVGMQNNSRYVYVYDIRHKLWHRENSENNIRMMCRVGNDICAAGDNSLIFMNGNAPEQNAAPVEWNFTLMLDDKLFEKKSFGRISVRYSLGKDAFFTARPIYDNKTPGALCGARHDEVLDGGGYLHLPLKRCRNFRIQFKGKGFFCMKSLRMQFYSGSEI